LKSQSEVETLYRQYGAIVLRRARAILGDEQAAKDAMQEVFIRVLRGGAEFRQEASPATWLYRITTNLCLNSLRNDRRRAIRLRTQACSSETVAAGVEDQLTIRRLLEQLPEGLREIAIYYHVDRMNQDEIAEIIGVSRRTVGYRLEQFKSQARAMSGVSPEAA
jgi:RNA polymerase sigma-70 factor (ECF subfamily)